MILHAIHVIKLKSSNFMSYNDFVVFFESCVFICRCQSKIDCLDCFKFLVVYIMTVFWDSYNWWFDSKSKMLIIKLNIYVIVNEALIAARFRVRKTCSIFDIFKRHELTVKFDDSIERDLKNNCYWARHDRKFCLIETFHRHIFISHQNEQIDRTELKSVKFDKTMISCWWKKKPSTSDCDWITNSRLYRNVKRSRKNEITQIKSINDANVL